MYCLRAQESEFRFSVVAFVCQRFAGSLQLDFVQAGLMQRLPVAFCLGLKGVTFVRLFTCRRWANNSLAAWAVWAFAAGAVVLPLDRCDKAFVYCSGRHTAGQL